MFMFEDFCCNSFFSFAILIMLLIFITFSIFVLNKILFIFFFEQFLRKIKKLAQSLVCPSERSVAEVRAFSAFQTDGTIINHETEHFLRVGFNTQAEVNLVSVDFIQMLKSKNTQHQHQTEIKLVAANQKFIQTYGTYTLQLKLTDHHEKQMTTLCTYITVKQAPDEPEILLGMPGLVFSQIVINTAQKQ